MQKETVSEKIQNYWSVRSESYSNQNLEEMNNWKRNAWKNCILKRAPQKETLDILDVGTGPGFFAINLALEGHHVTAVDVTQDMLLHARQNAKAYGADVTFLQQNAEHLDFADHSFDLIINRNVIWNLEQPLQAFQEWKRVLRPGGRFVYFDANWYLYLFDKKNASMVRQARRTWNRSYPNQCQKETLQWEKKNCTRVQMLENIAKENLPLSKIQRPQWDQRVLEHMGMKIIEIQKDIGPEVLSDSERIRWKGTPLFMVCAEKEDETD